MAFKSDFQGRTIDEQIDYVKNKLPGIIENFTNELSKINKDKAEASSVPQKTSQITNDSGYITGKTLEEALSVTTEDIINMLRTEHAEHIAGDEIDTKYKAGEYIPSLLLYEGAYIDDGKYDSYYENAPFQADGIIITHSCTDSEGNPLAYQFALSWDGKIVHRCCSDEDSFSEVPWSDNFIPTKVSQLENDKNFVSHDTLYGDEIDNKWNYNTEAPMMMYHISNGYDRSPFEECFILNKAYPCPDSEDSFCNMQIAISKDGKIKYRYANDDALDAVDWYEDATPTKLSQLKDDIGFDDVKTMYDTLMDGGYNTDKIISAFESAFEGRQIANENVERIESVESSIAEFGAVISEKEDAANKITSILQDATDTQYPSAKASYKAIENAKDTAMRYADSITKDFIFGSEIDEKYNADSVIPQILTYYSSGYDNAPFSTSGIIITSMADETGEDEYGSYKVCPQWAISELGELKYRIVTYGETNYRTPWSENLIPTKLSQLKNDTGYLEPKSLFGEQLFYNEIDTKYYPGKKNIPLVMTYDSRNRDNADEYYENAPFFQCTIITMHQECFYGDMENINYTSYQIATDGCSIKVRWGAADNTETFESIPWVKIPSADDIDELEDKIGDIETALDSIIEIQNALIGGDA